MQHVSSNSGVQENFDTSIHVPPVFSLIVRDRSDVPIPFDDTALSPDSNSGSLNACAYPTDGHTDCPITRENGLDPNHALLLLWYASGWGESGQNCSTWKSVRREPSPLPGPYISEASTRHAHYSLRRGPSRFTIFPSYHYATYALVMLRFSMSLSLQVRLSYSA